MGPQDELFVCYTEAAQGPMMQDVLDTCIKYLQLHPSEFIMMRVKESFAVNYALNNSFGVCLSKLINARPEFFWTNARLPTVKKARGKVVILKDFNGTEFMGVPFSYDHVSDNPLVNNRQMLGVDAVLHHLQASTINEKMEHITRNMNSTEVGLSKDASNLYITFSSGSSPSAYPVGVAERINPLLDGFLEKNRGKRAWGYVVMDFPGQALINGIISSNFRVIKR